MDPEYIEKIQEWVKYDNIITRNKDEIKEFSEKKKLEIEDAVDKSKELEEDILEYITSKKLEKLTINISDGKIKFLRKNNQTPLSMKTVNTILDSYTKTTKIDTKELYKYIQDNAPRSESISIKRDLS